MKKRLFTALACVWLASHAAAAFAQQAQQDPDNWNEPNSAAQPSEIVADTDANLGTPKPPAQVSPVSADPAPSTVAAPTPQPAPPAAAASTPAAPSSPAALAEPKNDQQAKNWLQGFGFGSYGRVGAASDLEGGPGRKYNQAIHGPRLGEGPYLELDFFYDIDPFEGSATHVQTVSTLAFNEELFHFNGKWDSGLALRNLYVEATNVFAKGLAFWIGSRSYRGDDVYLLDFWPLDNLNTLGGGIHYRRNKTWIGWHAGFNRLKDLYQYQEVEVPGLDNTSETVVLLNRQRFITSLKVEQLFGGDAGALGSKVKLYGEVHALPDGTLNAQLPDQDKREELPADSGWLAGAEVALWNFGPNSHANLFARFARGLAAYGEFAIPFGLDNEKSAKDASEFLTALSFNWETARWFGLQLGTYLRRFKDADPNKYDWQDGWEYVIAARPHLFLTRIFELGAEVSHQTKYPFGLNPWTNEKEVPGVFQISALPALTFGKGSYARPQLRLIYTATHLNESARASYNPLDPRSGIEWGHYLGVQAEWWFNSTYR